MRAFRKIQWSANSGFIIVASLITAIVLIITIAQSISVYRDARKEQSQTLLAESIRIEQALTRSFDYVDHLTAFFADNIVKNQSLDYINKLLSTRLAKRHSVWTNFDWVTTDSKVAVSSKTGILKKPKDVSFRDYLKITPKYPGKLLFGVPVVGIPSGEWIIPAGRGIADANGTSLGTIALGFSIPALEKELRDSVVYQPVVFGILDDKQYTDIYSNMDDTKPDNQINLGNIKLNDQSGSLLAHENKGVIYTYYRKSPKYPYTIVVGVDRATYMAPYWKMMYPISLGMVSLLLIISMLIVFYRKVMLPLNMLYNNANRLTKEQKLQKMPRRGVKEIHTLAKQILSVKRYMVRIKRIDEKKIADKHSELLQVMEMLEASDKARERFARRVRYEMEKPLDNIVQSVRLLAANYLGELDFKLSKKQKNKCLQSIFQSTHHLRMLTSDDLSLDFVNVAEALEECVTIKVKTAYSKQVTLEKDIQADLPSLYADEVRFKQIVTGVLTRILDFVPKDKTVNLTAFSEEQNLEKSLVITIKDNGFGFDNDRRDYWEEKDRKEGLARRVDGTHLSIYAIESLIKLHQGNIHYEDVSFEGSTVTIKIPYRTPEDKEGPTKRIDASENVVRLFK